jgi:hypothetical protein
MRTSAERMFQRCQVKSHSETRQARSSGGQAERTACPVQWLTVTMLLEACLHTAE